MFDSIIDFDNLEAKRELLRQFGSLRGKLRIKVTDARRGRTNQQNRWYFGQIVKSFALYWSDVSGEPVTTEQAHEFLAKKFLTYTVVNEETAEFIELVKSTAKLNTKEMAEYCELCRNYMAQSHGIIVPDPDPNWKENKHETQRGTD